MRQLPEPPDLDQLRRQAHELLRAAVKGERSAIRRIGALSKPLTLSAAQLAVARDYGFSSWARLKAEVDRLRAISTTPVPQRPRSARAMEELPAGRDVRTWQGMRDWSAELL